MLLGPEDKAPFYVLNEDSALPYIIVCEHAGRNVPQSLDNLGLDDEDFNCHYAVDLGAKEMTEALSVELGAMTVVANYSRLVVDLNRRSDHAAAFPTSAEGKDVPVNVAMTEEGRQARLDEIYTPFHSRIREWIDAKIESGIVPAIISIHSYTPVFFGVPRPWEIGILWAQDKRMPGPFINYFKDKGYVVGDNEPYDARILRGGTMEIHGDGRKIPNLLVEYRNDLLLDKGSFNRFVTHTVEAIKMVTSDDSVYSYYDGPETPYDPEAEKRYIEQVVKTIRS